MIYILIDKRTVFLFISILLSSFTQAQKTTETFFRPNDLMLFGSYYYPEQWDSSQWDRDLKKMADMGFNFTHFAEFAWANLEPEEGKYDFSWLDKAVELAKKNGLKVIMCTPTAAPPVWLTEKYPDILIKNAEGISAQHGARQHVSWASEVYRGYVEKIVSELGRRYGKDEAVIGWQIDNEPSHYGCHDYNQHSQKKFRTWLQQKYGTVTALNNSWGNAFWSQTYQNFNQILIPNSKEMVCKANPHAMLDFQRFVADEVADFVNWQADILRKHTSKKQWITTNTIPQFHPVDPRRMERLDFQSYTRYLIIGSENGYGDQGFRIGSDSQLSFPNDIYRNYPGKTFGVMELQPGQVNWGGFNPQTYPGAVRLWIYHIFAGGGKFVCNYRFRQPLKGSEQYHYGMIGTDGITPNVGGREYMQTIREFDLLKKKFDKRAYMPHEMTARRTAILYSPENEWEMNFQNQTWQWNTNNHIQKYHKLLKQMATPVDIISEQEDFLTYPVMIAPAYQLLDEALIARWEKYVRQGGQLILTCRTGQKDREAHLWESPFAQPILNLIGAKDLFFDHMPSDKWSHVSMNGTSFDWNNWADVMTPLPGTEIWGEYADQFYKGKAAVLHRKVGKGSVTYVGVDSDDAALEKTVLRKLYAEAGIPVQNLPAGVTIEWNQGFYIGLNYTSDTQEIPIPEQATIIIGTRNVPAAGVVVWQ